MFHHPGRSLRFPTKERTCAPLLLGGATIPTTMSSNTEALTCYWASPNLGCRGRSSSIGITGVRTRYRNES
jgi:hypothetical protein